MDTRAHLEDWRSCREVLHHCNGSPMHWSDVQLFLAVARHGSLRSTALAVGVDASTVSRRIASLEHALGARLFERTPEGLVLTPSGKQMVQSGERVDGELEDLSRRLKGHDRRLSGVVRVTLPGSFSALASNAVAMFVERHPRIEVELLTMDALVDIDGRKADVALRVADAPPDDLVGRRIAGLAGALYAARRYVEAHGQPLEDPGHRWIDWDRRLAGKPAFAWIAERYPDRRVVARGLSTVDVAHAVLAGIGIGALPCLVGDREPSLVRLLDAPRGVWSSVWLLTHRELRPAARVRAVIDHLTTSLIEQKPRIEGSVG